MQLSDIYCLYNRARGTDLISPEDLIKACSLFEDLNLPVKLMTISHHQEKLGKEEEGERGLQQQKQKQQQHQQHSPDETIFDGIKVVSLSLIHGGISVESVADFVVGKSGGKVSALDVSVGKGIPLSLAKDYLFKAEEACILTRDESVEGVLFYPNLFVYF